jgi:uncharacterized protein (DUF2147 family)
MDMRALVSSFMVSVVVCGTAMADGIEGKWKRGDGNALVRIAPCGDKVCATNLWIGDTSKGEAAGDRLVMSLTPGAAGSFSGTAYDAKRKLNYSIVLTPRKGGLTTRGCFVGKLICKDVSWTAAR